MAAKTTTSTKLIVSNRAALLGKYGTAGVKAIEKAVAALAQADKARSITTKLIYLDDKKALGTKAVKSASNDKQNKVAIDAVCAKWQNPDYLMILGAPDVVPYQILNNPVGTQDNDANVPSDLPYACAAAYSKTVGRFVGPTRVVGRLPDLRGGSLPQYLVGLLAAAAAAAPLAQSPQYFGVTASVWKKSTQLSLQSVFGNSTSLLIAPPQGTNYAAGALAAQLQLVNCHGGPADPQFYGQSGNLYPPAMHSQHLGVGAGGVGNGCVAAFECCYGAELYPPAMAANVASIADTYLSAGAYGVAGSTTIAYGPAASTDWADVLCAMFLTKVRSGASLGRAMLEARQDYVASKASLSPTDLKTLAQYVLLGDPSIHPVAVQASPAHAMFASVAGGKSFAGPAAAEVAQRKQRRAKLVQFGVALAAVTPKAGEKPRSTSAKAKQMLETLLETVDEGAPAPVGARAFAKTASLGPVSFATYDIAGSAGQKSIYAAAGAKSVPATAEAVHIAIEPLAPLGNTILYKISEVYEVGGQLVPRAVGYCR